MREIAQSLLNLAIHFFLHEVLQSLLALIDYFKLEKIFWIHTESDSRERFWLDMEAEKRLKIIVMEIFVEINSISRKVSSRLKFCWSHKRQAMIRHVIRLFYSHVADLFRRSDSAIIYINLSSCDIENVELLVMNEVIKYVRLRINQSYPRRWNSDTNRRR